MTPAADVNKIEGAIANIVKYAPLLPIIFDIGIAKSKKRTVTAEPNMKNRLNAVL